MLSKILHVEDDHDIREIALMALETVGGFTVEQCPSGGDALTKVRSFVPDLFLLDVMMPDMSGLETLAELRKMPELADIPAIFMTAKAHPREVSEFMDAGAISVITKPFDPITLADEIRDIWNARSDHHADDGHRFSEPTT
ncbi:MAG: response regulator [Paracoccaceae bacterium]